MSSAGNQDVQLAVRTGGTKPSRGRNPDIVFSPGSTVGACTREESYASIAKAINMVHKEVPEVITVIENMVSYSAADLDERDRG